MPQIDFSNPNDGIDWEHALPPHIAQAMQAPAPPPQSDRTLVFDWPLPENHHALQRRRPNESSTRRQVPTVSTVEMSDFNSSPSTRRFASRRSLAQEREQDLYDHWNGVQRTPPPPRMASTRTTAPTTAVDSRMQHSRSEGSVPPVTTSLPNRAAHAASTREPPSVPTASRNTNQTSSTSTSEWEIQDFSYESLLELGSLAVSTGLSKNQLQRMQPKPFDGEQSGECSICLEGVERRSLCIELPCHHVFHHECIITWLARNNKCPTCRFEIRRREP